MRDKKQYIGYYRVSTEEQGESGLGLTAQKHDVRRFVSSNGALVGEFQDIESGAKDCREGLNLAIEACKRTGATLVVKNLSRISRGGYRVMMDLEEAGIEFIESTSPNDNQMVKELKFSFAKEERKKISERTTSALSVIKEKLARGEVHVSKSGNVVVSLGTPENLTPAAILKAAEVRARIAREDLENIKATAYIVALVEAGKSFYYITNKLNENGFVTSRGNRFSQTQTKRLYERSKE